MWPPILTDLKDDLGVEVADDRDDTRLGRDLNAAVTFVEDKRAGDFNFDGLVNVNSADLAALETLPGVDATVAQAIVDGRAYGSVSDVQAVVGDVVFAGIDEDITVAPDPSDTLVDGTLALARRWYTRRRSPDGLVSMADLGISRIPSIDPDIERMLGIGRFRKAVFA